MRSFQLVCGYLRIYLVALCSHPFFFQIDKHLFSASDLNILAELGSRTEKIC